MQVFDFLVGQLTIHVNKVKRTGLAAHLHVNLAEGGPTVQGRRLVRHGLSLDALYLPVVLYGLVSRIEKGAQVKGVRE